MRFLLSIAIASLALAASAGVARADGDDYVECKGEYAIEGDAAVAKDRAYKQALRDCVEKKLGTYVVSSTQTKDFQALQDTVMSSAQGFVTDAKELESKGDNGIWTVRLRAKVATALIDNEAKARNLTLATMKFPRIALIISEQHLGQAGKGGPNVSVDQRVAENTIIGEWKAAGAYQFVDLDALGGKVRSIDVASLSAQSVREYSNLLDADLMIFGSAVATRIGDVGTVMGDREASGMQSCKASLSVRAYTPDSGDVIATSDVSKTALNISDLACEKQAVKAAAKALASDLEKKLLNEWNQRVMGSSRVRLRVKGLKFDGVKAVRTALGAEFKAVSSVSQRSFADGVAEFDLKVEGGDVEALADAFSSSKTFSKQKLEVTGATSNTITLEAK